MSRCSSSGRRLSVLIMRQRGFTYLGLVIMVAIIGLVAVCSVQVGAITQRRAAENELMEIGKQYIAALNSYAQVTPEGQSSLPDRIEELLSDSRFPGVRRHLRKQYIDPLTGNNQWGLVYGVTETGRGITGVYSLSEAVPIKQDNFDAVFRSFRHRNSYHDWVFSTLPAAELNPEPVATPEPVPSPASRPPGKNPRPTAPGTQK